MALGEHQRDLLLLAILGLALFLPGIANHDLWNPDEPRYAQVANEMRQSGEYLVPHLNGEIYSHKPPLLFWTIAAASLLTRGVDELSTRLPSALAAVGTLLLVFALGRRFFDRRTAWFSALVFATAIRIVLQGRTGQIDMLLTFLVALAVWFWVRGYEEDRLLYYRLFFVATGLATLAKGPVGLLPPLLGIVTFLAWSRDLAALKRLRIGSGLLIWMAVVLVWLIPAGLLAGREYLDQILFAQNVTRFTDPGSRSDMGGHVRPWYYFLKSIPADFFPWIFYLPSALVAVFRRRNHDPWPRFLLCWLVVTVVFFSLSPGKRNVYVLTAFPALALLVGHGIDRLSDRLSRAWSTLPATALAILALALTAALPTLAARNDDLEPIHATPTWLIALAPSLLAAGALVSAWAAWRRRPRVQVASLGAGMAGLALVYGLVLAPVINPLKTSRPLAERLKTELAPGETFALYMPQGAETLESSLLFYSEHFARLIEERDLEALATSEGAWLVANKTRLAQLESYPELVEVARDQNQRDGWVLLRSRGRPESG